MSCQYVCTGKVCGGQCTPGNTQCNGLIPQTCDTTGTWQGTTPCSGTKPVCSSVTHQCVQRSQGDTCTTPSECQSNYCVPTTTAGKSVCCNAPCNGTCDTNFCDGGSCGHVAASMRKQCDMVPDTGGDHNSSYSDAIYSLCDGNGGCKAPNFNCGTGGPCPRPLSASMYCCNHAFGEVATSCTDLSAGQSCFASYGDNSEVCRDDLDCPASMHCCKVEGAGYRGLFCNPVCADPSLEVNFQGNSCDPTRSNGGTCPAGQHCLLDYDGTAANEYLCQ
jgi:hypothetical protein